LKFLIAEEPREGFAWSFVLAQLCGRGLFLFLSGQRAANRKQPDAKQTRRAYSSHERHLTVGKSIPIGLAFPVFLCGVSAGGAVAASQVSGYRTYRELDAVVL